MAKPTDGGGELFIELDIAGLAALMKTIEAAMAGGQGRMALHGDGGMSVRSGASTPYSEVIVTFAGPSDFADVS